METQFLILPHLCYVYNSDRKFIEKDIGLVEVDEYTRPFIVDWNCITKEGYMYTIGPPDNKVLSHVVVIYIYICQDIYNMSEILQ